MDDPRLPPLPVTAAKIRCTKTEIRNKGCDRPVPNDFTLCLRHSQEEGIHTLAHGAAGEYRLHYRTQLPDPAENPAFIQATPQTVR